MKNIDKNLFQIGEVTKLVAVTRRMILNYEDLDLLVPAVKDPKSGYRYYSADNITQIRLIRSLQNLGLSLSEIHGYLANTIELSATIERLEKVRDQLNDNIIKLRVRSEKNDVHKLYWTTLPQQKVFFRKIVTDSIEVKAAQLREAYIEAARKYGLDNNHHMFIENPLGTGNECMLCIPVMHCAEGENICILPETQAISIYHRGAYEEISAVRKKITDYIADKKITDKGFSRNIFIEGPPNRGNDKANYVTEITVPVASPLDGL